MKEANNKKKLYWKVRAYNSKKRLFESPDITKVNQIKKQIKND